jgi:hypothetical protein
LGYQECALAGVLERSAVPARADRAKRDETMIFMVAAET